MPMKELEGSIIDEVGSITCSMECHIYRITRYFVRIKERKGNIRRRSCHHGMRRNGVF